MKTRTYVIPFSGTWTIHSYDTDGVIVELRKLKALDHMHLAENEYMTMDYLSFGPRSGNPNLYALIKTKMLPKNFKADVRGTNV